MGEGAPCTWFLASTTPVSRASAGSPGALEPRGIITIDAGARAALDAGRSLLPAGVTRVEGNFDRGDAVVIKDADGRELGRGLIAYARRDAERLIGRKSGEIEGILGYSGRSEMIHRDDMALNRS